MDNEFILIDRLEIIRLIIQEDNIRDVLFLTKTTI